VFDHAVNTREIYRNRQYRTRVLKIIENLFLETKEKKTQNPAETNTLSLEKEDEEEELFLSFSLAKRSRRNTTTTRESHLNRREREDFFSSARVVRKGEFRKRI
jgi:hypothetical protein